MEDLMGRVQIASSCDQHGPYVPGTRRPLMAQACTPTSNGTCVAKLRGPSTGKAPIYVQNPPPEENPYFQRVPDEDVRYETRKKAMPTSIGASSTDISRGNTLYSSAADMPTIRKVVMFDTRTRDPAATPTASSVVFKLDQPIFSVSRILVLDARVPIYLDPTNSGLEAEDYVMLSVGYNLNDSVLPSNLPVNTSASVNSRALAYIPLVPTVVGSKFASLKPLEPPGAYYTDFRTPIANIEQIELSWWRFAKGMNDSEKYIIPNTHAGAGQVGTVDENAYVTLAFFGRDRRPE